jgi:hypothetical protein
MCCEGLARLDVRPQFLNGAGVDESTISLGRCPEDVSMRRRNWIIISRKGTSAMASFQNGD